MGSRKSELKPCIERGSGGGGDSAKSQIFYHPIFFFPLFWTGSPGHVSLLRQGRRSIAFRMLCSKTDKCVLTGNGAHSGIELEEVTLFEICISGFALFILKNNILQAWLTYGR